MRHSAAAVRLCDSLMDTHVRCNCCHPTSRSANPTLRITSAARRSLKRPARVAPCSVTSSGCDSLLVRPSHARQLAADGLRRRPGASGRRAPRTRRREQRLEPRLIQIAPRSVLRQRDAILDRAPVTGVGQPGETPPEPGHDFIHEVVYAWHPAPSRPPVRGRRCRMYLAPAVRLYPIIDQPQVRLRRRARFELRDRFGVAGRQVLRHPREDA